jgi:hypothetical protein
MALGAPRRSLTAKITAFAVRLPSGSLFFLEHVFTSYSRVFAANFSHSGVSFLVKPQRLNFVNCLALRKKLSRKSIANAYEDKFLVRKTVSYYQKAYHGNY